MPFIPPESFGQLQSGSPADVFGPALHGNQIIVDAMMLQEPLALAHVTGEHLRLLFQAADKGGAGQEPLQVPGKRDEAGVLPDRVFLTGNELEFLHDLDFLILAMPLTSNTEGIVGERELAALPRSAFLLNPARGPVVQEKTLLRALTEHWIAGAALDTHYQYPMPAEHPLWNQPNVIFTPHISGSSLNPMFQTRLWDIFSQNVQRYLRGEKLLNELTAEQLRGE